MKFPFAAFLSPAVLTAFLLGSASEIGRAAEPAASTTVLTPAPAAGPRLNGPGVFAARPGAPFLYAIPATGDRPLTFAAPGLPDGLKLDAATGRITGVVRTPGEYRVTLHAANVRGQADKPFRIVIGEALMLTPPLGWNSYNCFGGHVTQDRATRVARAIVSLGLDRHGWTYVNLDDGWQGRRGGSANALQADPAIFPDIAGFVREVHALGLKAGLYSTPWTVSYDNRLGGSSENPEGKWDETANLKAAKNHHVLPYSIGKYSFANVDAQQFADWGFDYLKYDWGPVEAPETIEMEQALRATGRDLVLSLSNNHVKNLLPIIGEVSKHAQSWRTTTDIRDVWSRIANDIGFNEDAWAPYARPGHYNDADMLVIGQVGGWANKLAPSHLKPDEQYTHISLWCLLASPLLIGCDLENMDPFTLGLLTNDEVLEIDQDALCKQAVRVAKQDALEVYAKPMEDGSCAVGVFNRGDAAEGTIHVNWADLKLKGKCRVRDLWRQQDLGVYTDGFDVPAPPSHGVLLTRIFPTDQTPISSL